MLNTQDRRKRLKTLQRNLPTLLHCSMELSQEKRVSPWLRALPYCWAALLCTKLPLPQIWMVTSEFTISLQLQTTVQCRACPDLQNWRFPSCETQWSERYHCHDTDWNLSWGVRWASPTATFRWVHVSSFCHPWKWCLTGYCNVWILGRRISKCICWCKGIQS